MAKGFRQIVKEYPELNEPLTLTKLENILKDIFKEKVKRLGFNPLEYPKHYVWEEDGYTYSMWELRPGTSTGDGGMELYSQSLKDYAETHLQEDRFFSSQKSR